MNRILKAQLGAGSTSRVVNEDAVCKYPHRDCMLNCVEGYDYCIRHILEDKSAPFKQCAYSTKSGKRCPIAAPKQERKDAFCHEHAKKALLTRQRLSRKRRPKETPDSLVEELAASHSGTSDSLNHENRRGRNSSDSVASKSLEYASSSDSEAEAPLVGHTWRDDGDSDADSIDSDQEDMLKYAGIYTTEEVAQILRDKLIRLQALYIDQFKRLRHILLTRRKKYLQAQRKERETFGSIKLYKNDPYMKKKYEKLCAMKRYHKKFGKESLLQSQLTERRMKATEGAAFQPPTFTKCVFVDEGDQCNARVVPLSQYCQKHILHDPGQVLYRPCPFGDSQCGRPVPTLFNMEFCSLHHRISPLKDVDTEEFDLKPPSEVLRIQTQRLEPVPELSESSKATPPLEVPSGDVMMEEAEEDAMMEREIKEEEEDGMMERELKEEEIQEEEDSQEEYVQRSLFPVGEEDEVMEDR